MAASPPVAVRAGRERFAALKDRPVIERVEPTSSTQKPPIEDQTSDRVLTFGYITTTESLTPFSYGDTVSEYYSQEQTQPLFVDTVRINTGKRALTADQLSRYPQWILAGEKVLETKLQIDAHTPKRSKAWKEFVVRAISRYAFARTEWALSSRYARFDGLGSRNASLDHIIYVDPVLLDELDLSIQQLRVLMNPALTDAYLVLPFANDLTAPDEIIKSRRAEKRFVESTTARFYAWSRSMVRLAHNTNERDVSFEDLYALGDQLLIILQNTDLTRVLDNLETSDEAVQELQLKYRNILVALLEQTTRDQVDQAYVVRLDSLIADIILATDADKQQSVFKEFDELLTDIQSKYPKDIDERIQQLESQLEQLETQETALNKELTDEKDFVAEQDAIGDVRNQQIAVLNDVRNKVSALENRILLQQAEQRKARENADSLLQENADAIEQNEQEIQINDNNREKVGRLIDEMETRNLFFETAEFYAVLDSIDAINATLQSDKLRPFVKNARTEAQKYSAKISALDTQINEYNVNIETAKLQKEENEAKIEELNKKYLQETNIRKRNGIDQQVRELRRKNKGIDVYINEQEELILQTQEKANNFEKVQVRLIEVVELLDERDALLSQTTDLTGPYACFAGLDIPQQLKEFDQNNFETIQTSDRDIQEQLLQVRFEIVKKYVDSYNQGQLDRIALYNEIYEQNPFTKVLDDTSIKQVACWFGFYDPFLMYFDEKEQQYQQDLLLLEAVPAQIEEAYEKTIEEINARINSLETQISGKKSQIQIEQNTLDGLPKPKTTTNAERRIQDIPSEIERVREQKPELKKEKQDLESQLEEIDRVKEAIATMAEEFRALSEAGLVEDRKVLLRKVQLELLSTRSPVFTSPVFDLVQQWTTELFDSLLESKPYSQQFNPTSTNQAVVLAERFPLLYSKQLGEKWRRQRLGISP